MKRKNLIFLCVFALVCLMSFSVVNAAPVDHEEIAEYITTHMERFDIPGMAFVLVVDGQIQFVDGFGVLKAGTEEKVNADTNFCIASVSKNFTSLAILQLQEEGLLKITDPVVKYLPWFSLKDAEKSKKITIEDLMQHTSGVPTTAYGYELKNGAEDDLEAQIREGQKIALTAEPGTTFQYSNFNFWTQALLVETLTGMKFADYMLENVFEPAGMDRTGYYRQVADQGNLAMGHRYERGQSRVFDYQVPAPTNAAGGVYTNANDMGHYIMTLLHEGKGLREEVLDPESVEQFFYSGIDEDFHYSYGLAASKRDGHVVIQHGGDNPNYTADMFLLPDQEIGFALLSNSQHILTHMLGYRINQYLLGNELTPIETTPTEGGAQTAKMIAYGSYLVALIGVIWLVFAIRGIRKGKYVWTSKRPGIVRFILQVILVPLVGIGVAFVGYQLPVKMIGSYHIALLYQPDLVKGVLGLITAILLFTFLVAVMAFVRKPESISTDKSKTM